MSAPGALPQVSEILPQDDHARLIGRVLIANSVPIPVLVRGNDVWDLRPLAATVSQVLERPDLVAALDEVITRTPLSGIDHIRGEANDNGHGARDSLILLSPVDLQVIKACGVTFAGSMLERLIEERSAGDPMRANVLRADIESSGLGDEPLDLASIVPGSDAAAALKTRLTPAGLWSQYLEVGLGPDPEVFTKAPVLSTVGSLSHIGIPAFSKWNNPEPELVLVVSSAGIPVGATLGNDVNLRDVEGRSALLLGMAKDNNRSAALGPFVRIFDDAFTLEQARTMEINLRVDGADGFVLRGTNVVAALSRSFEALIGATCGRHHQYPDGFALFTGTLFAPTEDRDAPGYGFTHHLGDIVTISSSELGCLVDIVGRSEELTPWTYGLGALLADHRAGTELKPTEKNPI
ncbi:MAG: fumarylacetoacetate hydrolase family protein [Mycobacterium sp.]